MMSIQFGILGPRGSILQKDMLSDLAKLTERYALDGVSLKLSGRLGMGYQSYRTHERMQDDAEPRVCPQGRVLSFDGRLDNFKELSEELGLSQEESPDTTIVLAAYERWKGDCFSKLIGDWALVLWDPLTESLYLARDHAGTRTLYFEERGSRLVWSTYLESFEPLSRKLDIDGVFASTYLACAPTSERTPFNGIWPVLPGHLILFRNGSIEERTHWSWLRGSALEYSDERQYSEHFIHLFSQSIERRTGPGSPILAQLSGGLDSSSIVCLSDQLRKNIGREPTELLDTVSYFDESEAAWDESPYFKEVERNRGKVGLHIPLNLNEREIVSSDIPKPYYLWPGADESSLINEQSFDGQVKDRGYRSILSGIGGDELLGGVPDPHLELADYMRLGAFRRFFTQGLAWSLALRIPIYRLAVESTKFAGGQYFARIQHPKKLAPWLTQKAVELVRSSGPQSNSTNWKHRPSEIAMQSSAISMLETMPHLRPRYLERREWRYPYLDRDLVEFLLSVPRNILVRPGRRRYLMRIALHGTVPDMILERRRKAFIVQSPLSKVSENAEALRSLCKRGWTVEQGLCDRQTLLDQVEAIADRNDLTWFRPFQRWLSFELWLRASYQPSMAIND